MHFEYPRQYPRQYPEPNESASLEMVVRNRGGGVPNVSRNSTGTLAIESPSTTTPADHQYQRRLLVLRERLRRALYN